METAGQWHATTTISERDQLNTKRSILLQAKMNCFDAEFRTLQQNASKNGVVADGVAGPATVAEAKLPEKATSEGGPLGVRQPAGFAGHLKEYQLKGLQWLVSLYEQVTGPTQPYPMRLSVFAPPHISTHHLMEHASCVIRVPPPSSRSSPDPP